MVENLSSLSQEKMREYLLFHAEFLRHLYHLSSQSAHLGVRSLLAEATPEELSVLLEVLRRIFIGEIRLTKEGSAKVYQSRKFGKAKRLGEKKIFLSLVNSGSASVVTYLLQLSNLYHHLLHKLMHLK